MIGRSIIHQDSIDKVTGAAKFAGDYFLPGTLHLKLKLSGRPHAQIRSINTSVAEKSPGVIAVFTAQDIPVNRYGLIVNDQPVLCDEIVRYEGDPVAVVVAQSPTQAFKATGLIEVEYQDLPVIADPNDSLKGDAPLIHEKYPGNIAHSIRIRRGDTATALKEADVIYENIYKTPMQEHAFLELEAGVAYVDDQGSVVIRTACQSIHDIQHQIAHALDLPEEQVRVITGPVGGAFGGREDISIQIVLALAAWKLRQPVRMVWSRRESILGHPKRHATIIKHRWGADKNFKIIAAEVEILIDAGAYMCTSNSVLEGFHSQCVGPYEIPNIKMDGKAVFTNNIPGGAFRGYGAPQAAFAAELQITHLAELLGVDPVTIRLKNCLQDSSIMPTQAPVPGGTNLASLIEVCARESGCKNSKQGWRLPDLKPTTNRRRGFGFAVGMKATGYGYGFPEGSKAKVVLHGKATIEHADVYSAAVDVGQGAHSVLIQIAAHVLGIPFDLIEIHPGDTASSEDSGAAAASRLTYFAGNAVKLAAELALKSWRDENRPAVGDAHWISPPTTAPDPLTGACIDNVSYSYAAQGVIVEVDLETGQVILDTVIATHDPGRAINPQKVEGQIQGAVVQAMGWALLENFVTEQAMIKTNTLSTYLIPTTLDIPAKVKSIQIEKPDPVGPFGVRGVGEIPFIPLAPAVIAAIRDATGIWFNHLPIKPEEVVEKIKENNQA